MKAREQIRTILETAKNPVVMCSFGKDSVLLLSLAREIKLDIDIVWFKQNVSKEWKAYAEQIIAEWDLTVYSYAPRDSYYLPNEKGMTLVDEYSFGEFSVPVLTDTKHGERCAADLSSVTTPIFDYRWDATLTGCKDSDKHFILGTDYVLEDGAQRGNTKFYAPLRNMTDDQVLDAIKLLNIPYKEVDDRLDVCTNCLQGLSCPKGLTDSFKWNPSESLRVFRERFIPAYQPTG